MENSFNGVTFRLCGEVFAVDALRVREIVGGADLQPLSVEGEDKNFIQVRGKTVPVMDLRQKFGYPTLSKEGLNSFIAVQVNGNDRDHLMALWVDAVLDIVNVASQKLTALKGPLGEVPPRYLKAAVEGHGDLVYVLELDEVLGENVPEEKELVLENKAS